MALHMAALICTKQLTTGHHQHTNSLLILHILSTLHLTHLKDLRMRLHRPAQQSNCLRHPQMAISVVMHLHQYLHTQVLPGAKISSLHNLLRTAHTVHARAAEEQTRSHTSEATDPISTVDGRTESALNAETSTASRIIEVSILVIRCATVSYRLDYRRSEPPTVTGYKSFSIRASSRSAGSMRHMHMKMVWWPS
jgi:hypothetical protein